MAVCVVCVCVAYVYVVCMYMHLSVRTFSTPFILRTRLVTGVDVIGLLETDAAKPYVDSHDIASWLSEELGMYVDYGPGPKDHTWG